MKTLAVALGALLSSVPLAASALDLRVGTGSGCTHATLQAALTALQGVGGDHTIRINARSYSVPDGMVYAPTMSQGFVRLEGGYANCTATSPSGSPTTDAGRSIFDGAGGLLRSVLELQINGLVGSFQMRRIALQGGDATDLQQSRYSAGGGLHVMGQASVLVGSGVSIRNNLARYGGGAALAGSRVFIDTPLARVDFFIDEGAEIRDNSTLGGGHGGGIYCGGSGADGGVDARHASIVHRDGRITGNRASVGAALHCVGSYAGGGWQPRPNPGAVALIANNGSADPLVNFGDDVIFATLDLVVDPDPITGDRVLGAIGSTNNGLVLIRNNAGGATGGLRLRNWMTRDGASPAPAEPPRFRLQNILFIGNRVRHRQDGPSALSMEANARLLLAPSSPSMRCGVLPPLGPCVVFEDNAPTGSIASGDRVPLVLVRGQGQLIIEGAHVRANQAEVHLISAEQPGAFVALRSSIVEGNLVGGSDSVLFNAQGGPNGPADVFLSHVTVTGNSHDRYFRIDGNSRGAMQGTVLHNADPPRSLRFGSAPAANLTLRWCNYLTFLADSGFTGATHVTDSFGPLVTVTGPLAFDATFNPPLALIDRCQPPTTPAASAPFATPFDVYGNAFGFPVAPTNPNRLADLGAVEFRPDALLSDGFEAP
jgi:hypothetical protein